MNLPTQSIRSSLAYSGRAHKSMLNKGLLAALCLNFGIAFAQEAGPKGPPPDHDRGMREVAETLCSENPKRCEELKQRLQKEREACKADPEACRKQHEARREEWRKKFEERCKAEPKKCEEFKQRHPGGDRPEPPPPPPAKGDRTEPPPPPPTK